MPVELRRGAGFSAYPNGRFYWAGLVKTNKASPNNTAIRSLSVAFRCFGFGRFDSGVMALKVMVLKVLALKILTLEILTLEILTPRDLRLSYCCFSGFGLSGFGFSGFGLTNRCASVHPSGIGDACATVAMQ